MRAAALTLTLVAAGCALGPNYKRPTVPMTATFREQAVAQAQSFADLGHPQARRRTELLQDLRRPVDGPDHAGPPFAPSTLPTACSSAENTMAADVAPGSWCPTLLGPR